MVAFAYPGEPFRGLQPQPGQCTAGGALLDRLAVACNEMPHAVSWAARTDAGVAARANLMSCRLRGPMPTGAAASLSLERPDHLMRTRLAVLPRRVMARALVAGKHYRYTLPDLPGDRLARAADLHARLQAAVGTHDFTSLSEGIHPHPIRTLWRARATCLPNGRIVIDVLGQGFLRKMIRILVGTLLRELPLDAVLAQRNRTAAGPAAPPAGLRLERLLLPVEVARMVRGAWLRPGPSISCPAPLHSTP